MKPEYAILLQNYTRSLPDTYVAHYIEMGRRFLEHVGDAPLASPQDIRQAWQKWEAYLRRKNYADGTIHLSHAIVRRVMVVNNLPWPFAKGEAPMVREREVRAPALSEESVALSIEIVRGLRPSATVEPTAFHRCFWALATIYGLRREEMCNLTPESLNVKKKVIFVETLKHGRQRYHTVPDCIMPHLVDWGFTRNISVSYLSSLYHEVYQMAGADRKWVGWHCLRRSLVRYAIRDGIPTNTVHNFLRWKRSTRDMTERYSTAEVESFEGIETSEKHEDYEDDTIFFAKHPFLKYWE